MAEVKYEVLGRVIHPDTKQPIISSGLEYEPYNAITEKNNSKCQPNTYTGEKWPLSDKTDINQNILVTSFNTGVGNNKIGIEQNSKFLDKLMNNQQIILNIQEILRLQEEIEDISNRIETDILERDKIAKFISKDHNGAVLNYTDGTVSGDYYTHNPIEDFITNTGCKASIKDTNSTFGECYKYVHSTECDNNIKVFRQYCIKVNRNTTLKDTKQVELKNKRNNLIVDIQSYIEEAEQNYIVDRSSLNSDLYNMLFVYRGTKKVFSNITTFVNEIPAYGNPQAPPATPERKSYLEVNMDTFDVISNNNIWATYSSHGSIEAAKKAAAKLIESLGIDNVRVVKIVPLDTKLIIEGVN